MALSNSSKLNTILNELRAFFATHQAPTYFVAVSGGLDSMLLTHLLLELKLPIELVHVNYGLRGEESDEDQLFLKQFCRAHKLQFHCKKVALKNILAQDKSNLQAKARDLRYAYFRKLQQSTAQSFIVTAQHQSDQIETFWLQLTRGAGLKGLAGMSMAQDSLLRPLLVYSREELKTLALELNVHFREDSSNASLKYRRNYWRHELLPFLKATLPSLEQHVSLLQKHIKREIDQQNILLPQLASAFDTTKKISLIKLSNLTAYQVIELFKKNEIPSFVIRRIGELFRAENGKYLTWQDPLSQRHYYLVKQRQELQIFNDDLQEWNFQISTPGTQKEEGFLIDIDAICGAPFWRTLAPSDKIKVKGMQGSKKVLQILKEAGVPSPIRKRQLVLCDQEKVLAIPEVKVNSQILASTSTLNAAVLCFAKKL